MWGMRATEESEWRAERQHTHIAENKHLLRQMLSIQFYSFWGAAHTHTNDILINVYANDIFVVVVAVSCQYIMVVNIFPLYFRKIN